RPPTHGFVSASTTSSGTAPNQPFSASGSVQARKQRSGAAASLRVMLRHGLERAAFSAAGDMFEAPDLGSLLDPPSLPSSFAHPPLPRLRGRVGRGGGGGSGGDAHRALPARGSVREHRDGRTRTARSERANAAPPAAAQR